MNVCSTFSMIYHGLRDAAAALALYSDTSDDVQQKLIELEPTQG
jgi:hypothetical protein